MLTPKPRGRFSELLFGLMTGAHGSWDALDGVTPEDADDAQIALWAAYELHYRGLEDVDEDLEWHPPLLAARRRLEAALEADLRDRFTQPVPAAEPDFAESFFAFVAAHDGPSLAAHVQRELDRDQVLELLRWRSVYHLKESDATTWAVPRLPVRAKAALMELLFDEYGAGNPNRLHSHLFAQGMEAAGLSPEYGAYVDDAPCEILEQNNAMSLFGLHRRLRGAALGHLAAFEVTSSLPSRRIAGGLARLGLPQPLIDYYDEHVLADAVHEQQAVRDICGSLLQDEPALAADVYLGAFSALDLEDRVAYRALADWGFDA